MDYNCYQVYQTLVTSILKYVDKEIDGKSNTKFGDSFKSYKSPNSARGSVPNIRGVEDKSTELKFADFFSIENLPKMNGICVGDDHIFSPDLEWILSEVANVLCIPKNFTQICLMEELCKYMEKPKKLILRTIESTVNHLGGANWALGLVKQEKELFALCTSNMTSLVLNWLRDHDKLFKYVSKI